MVTGAKLRALLAVLALHAGRAVPADQLVDALWGRNRRLRPETGCRVSSRSFAARSGRRASWPCVVVATRSSFRRMQSTCTASSNSSLRDARRRPAATRHGAIELLAEADSLWRGDALAEFAYEDFASVEVSRMSELRLAAVEERLDIELQLGRHRGVIGELEALVTAHPLRERPRGLLMIALYRAGRQADALRIVPGRSSRPQRGARARPRARSCASWRPRSSPRTRRSTRRHDRPHDTAPRTEQRSTVPESLTPLVGRDDEVRDLTRLFHDHRFVTLVGPGGVGKTRLALEVARGQSEAPDVRRVPRRAGPRRRSGRGGRGDHVRPRPAGPEPPGRDDREP